VTRDACASLVLTPREAEMIFVWTPQRMRIVVLFIAGYIALC
jgi:hypothetical protein